MLRTIFVAAIVALGARYALRNAFGALLLYLWVAYFRPEGWLWNADWLNALNLSFVVGLYLLARTPGSDARFRFDVRSKLLFAFLGVSLASMLASDYLAYSWRYWLDFSKTIVITYLLVSLVIDESRFRIVVLVIALSLGFESAKEGWLTFFRDPGGINTNTLINIGDENETAVALLMLVPLFFALARTATTRWERWVHTGFAIGVAYRAVTTYSRGGFLACGALILMSIARSRHKMRAALAVGIISFVVVSVMPQKFWDRMSTIKTSEEELTDTSALSRLHFWRVAGRMVADRPLLGVGHNAFNAAYDKYDFSLGQYGAGRSVHSIWFGTAAELGLTGLLVFLLILGLAVAGCFRVAAWSSRGQVSPGLGHFARALQTSFCVLAVGGTFVPFQYKEMLWHFFGLSTALYALGRETVARAAVTQPVRLPAVNPSFRARPAVQGI
jgi:probable O-glycosylation ligase (exosortase A-associated)